MDTTSKPRVVILGTGGTIAGQGASNTSLTDYQAAVHPPEALLAAVPELARVARARCEAVTSVHSADMTVALWQALARRVNALFAVDEADGVVVTHGTATLEETAYFLNLTVNAERPVVVTGAMRPAGALSADGPLNLLEAVAVAAAPEARGQGVLVVLNGQINAARDVTKTNTLGPQAFASPDFGLLGYVVDLAPRFYRTVTRLHTTRSPFTATGTEAGAGMGAGLDAPLPRVDILHADVETPALVARALVDDALAAAARGEPRGIVCAASGGGTVPTALAAPLAEAARRGVAVVRATRVGSGPVCPLASDEAAGFLAADTLSPHKARVLLMLGLAHTRDRETLRQWFARC